MSTRAAALAVVVFAVTIPVHAITRSWTGATSASWSDASNWSPAAVPAPEDLLVFPAGVARTTMTNDLPAGTSFGAMHFAKGYTVDGNAMTLTGDLTFDQSTYPNFVMNAPLILGANVKLGAAITSEYRGAIDVNGHTLTIDSYNTRLIGAVNGSGTLNVSLPGLSIENGGIFSGAINGIVDVAGSLPNANVNGAASGNGTIGTLTATQPVFLGTKTPAYTSDPHTIGTLHTKSASISQQFFVDLVPGGVSDQLDVTGSVTLNSGSWLNVSVASGAVGAGQTFVIIANDAGDAVTGTFDGLPEGGQRSVPGGTVSISYHGGDGNDVVLTVVDAKKTWTGAVSGNWSNPNNWSPASVPAAGDSLVFPAGARTSMVNDLPSVSVGSMDFRSSYVLSGNAVTLGGDVFFDVNTPLFTCSAPLILAADVHLHYALTNDYTGAIDVNGHTLTIDSYNTTVNALLGTGTINVTGAGVRIAASGTFDGSINGGVDVAGTLPNADVAGGSVSGVGTIGALTTSGAFSHLYPGVKNPSYSSDPHTIGTLRTGSLSLGAGQFFVDIGPASDQLIVTGSVTLNNSWLNLSVPSGSIADGQSFVIIDNDGNDPVSGTFSGLAEGATIHAGGATLTLTYAGGDGNDVVLFAGNATKNWTGAQSALWSNPANWSPAAIPANGEVLRFPAGAANRVMTNDLNVAVGALDFRDSYNLGGNALTLTGDVTFSAPTFTGDAPLVLGADVHIGGALTNNYNGAVDVNGHTLTIDSYNTTFAGPLNGTGTVVITGAGMTFAGGGTFAGTINGTAEVLGAMPHAVINGGLSGSGSTGAVTIDSRLAVGAWAPAYSGDPHNVGTLETQSISIDGVMMVDVVGGGAASDQLKVAGAVILGDVTLVVSVPTGSPAAGQTFTIVDNDGTDAIEGTFAGRAEQSLFTSGPWMFRITYAGGDGNDVVLTAVEPTEVQTQQSAPTTQFGEPARFTAHLEARIGTPDGSVTFTDNGAALQTVLLVDGTATLQTELQPGTHTVAAVYEGTTLFGPSNGVISHVVLRGNTTSDIHVSAGSVVYGDPVDVSVAVHPIAPASGTPTGSVSVGGSTAALNDGNATASLVLDAGTHALAASYAGDARFEGSTSNASNVTVSKAPTTITAALNDNMLTITVTAPHRPSLAVSGSITVSENGAVLQQQSIDGHTAVLDLGAIPTGDHALTISFGAAKNFESSSTTVVFTAGPPQVSVSAVSVFEGHAEKNVAVLVELSSTTADTVTVSYATEDATANAGSDYRAASGTLTFAPGEITKTINITITGDTKVEDDESFLVRLSAPVNATLGSAAASVKLVNDDLAYRAQYGLVYAAPMTLDLYTPTAGTGPFPLIVFVPGTNAYDAQDAAPTALRETSRGYAVAVVRYRAPGASRFPAQIDDLRAAVRWLRTSASSLNIDAMRIAAWGNGAGAHLASLLGTTNDAGTGGSVSGDVQSVIAWGGVSDLMQLQSDSAAQGCGANFDDRNSAQSQLIGCALPSCTQNAIAASPLTHVTSGDAPFLLLHTRNDCNVPLAQSTRLYEALRAAGVRATLTVVDDAAHAFSGIDAFLDAQLQPRTSRRRASSP